MHEIDGKFASLSGEIKEKLYRNINIVTRIVQGVKNPHKKYKKSLFALLGALSDMVMNYSFEDKKENYILLADTVDKYVERYGLERTALPLAVKALYVSINRGHSVKNPDFDSSLFEDNPFERELRYLLEGSGRLEHSRYSFDEAEYDIDLIKARFVEYMKEKKDPFAEMSDAVVRIGNIDVMYDFIVDMISESVKHGVFDDTFIYRLLAYMRLGITERIFKDTLISHTNKNARKDPEAAALLMEYALAAIPERDRNKVWYLKWIAGYLIFIDDHSLNKGEIFNWALSHFMDVQKKRNFKSLQSVFARLMERFGNDGRRRTLF